MIPIIILSLSGILVLFLGFLPNRNILLPAAGLCCLAALGGVFYELLHQGPLQASLYGQSFMAGMMQMSTPAALFSATIITCGMAVLPFAQRYVEDRNAQLAEFCALMLFCMAGAIMMVSYTHLIMLFLGLEILSISVYVLSGTDKRNPRSNEAALKYFLLGAFFTGVLLFGVALLYGATGSFYLSGISGQAQYEKLALPIDLRTLGMALVLIGLLFKVSAVPFHFWTPDVYEGSPSVFTAFMATVVKTAGFGAIFQLLGSSFAEAADHQSWYLIIAASTALTLVLGNVLALVQYGFKRMMAYSSISHAGFMLIGLMAFNTDSQPGVLFYTLSYGLATITAFGVMICVMEKTSGDGLDPFRGLGVTHPFLAFALTVSLCSLAGIPLTAGFIGKFYMFVAALSEANTLWIVVLAVVMSAVSAYYYFRVIAAMYMSDRRATEAVEVTRGQYAVLYACTAATLMLGVAPGMLNWLYR